MIVLSCGILLLRRVVHTVVATFALDTEAANYEEGKKCDSSYCDAYNRACR